MSSIVMRRLDPAVKERPHIGLALMRAAQSGGGVEELPVPARNDVARSVEFG